MYDQMSLLDIPKSTFSPDLEYGSSPCERLASVMMSHCGPAPVLASLSARQAKAMGLLTSGTFGQPLTTSSPSAALQKSLENKLRQKLSMSGSTLYKLTWKPWVTPSGVSRFRLRASVLRKSETGPTGWPTPIVNDTTGSTHCYTGTNPDGSRKIALKLPGAVKLAAWATPDRTLMQAKPRPPIMKGRKPTDPQISLADVANLATPARLTVHGELLTGFFAGMESGGQLSPAHSLWLMLGPFATEWLRCVELATRSTSRRRKSGSNP